MWDALLLFSEGYIIHVTEEKKRKKEKEAGSDLRRNAFGIPDLNLSLRYRK